MAEQDGYNIIGSGLPQITDPAGMAGTSFEVAKLVGGTATNFEAPFGVIMQALNANLAGPNNRKDLRKAVAFKTPAQADYVPGRTTLATLDPQYLCVGATCTVLSDEDGSAYTEYELQADPTGPLIVWPDGSFREGVKVNARWVLKVASPGGGTGTPYDDTEIRQDIDQLEQDTTRIDDEVAAIQDLIPAAADPDTNPLATNADIPRLTNQLGGSTSLALSQEGATAVFRTPTTVLVTYPDREYIDLHLHANSWRVAEYYDFTDASYNPPTSIEVGYTNGNQLTTLSSLGDLNAYLDSLNASNDVQAGQPGGLLVMLVLRFHLPCTYNRPRTYWIKWTTAAVRPNFPYRSIHVGAAYNLTGQVGGEEYDPFLVESVRAAVLAGTYSGGELQGEQPAGSKPEMKFSDANYGYIYMRGVVGTLVWCRFPKG